MKRGMKEKKGGKGGGGRGDERKEKSISFYDLQNSTKRLSSPVSACVEARGQHPGSPSTVLRLAF